MSPLAAFCAASGLLLTCVGLLATQVYRFYEAERELARNAARKWEED